MSSECLQESLVNQYTKNKSITLYQQQTFNIIKYTYNCMYFIIIYTFYGSNKL